MNQSNSDELPPEVDFSGGVRGKYLARYQRWKSITSAVGTVEVGRVTSGGDEACSKIIAPLPQVIHVGARALSVVGSRIAPENLTASNAA